MSVSEVLYEPTDICATMKTNDDIFISWAYVCVDENTAAFVTWDGETCDSDESEVNVVKYFEDGSIDNGYWYNVDCSNERINYENITDNGIFMINVLIQQ